MTGSALDVAGSGPSGEDLGIALEDAIEDGTECMDADLATAEDAGDGGGCSCLATEANSLLTLAVLEFLDEVFEVGGGICGEAVSHELVIEGEIADCGGHGESGAGERGIAAAIWHAEAIHKSRILGIGGDGGSREVHVVEFVVEILAKGILFRGFALVGSARLNGLLTAEVANRLNESSAGAGKLDIHRGRRDVGELWSEGNGILGGSEDGDGLGDLSCVHGGVGWVG